MTSKKFLALVKERAIIKSKRGYTSEATRLKGIHKNVSMTVFVDTMEAIWEKEDI